MTEKSLIKGSQWLPLAKLYFVATGYAIYLGLARILGPESFGVYGIVVGIISVFNMVFITGTLQAVSKFVSEDESRAETVKRTALKIQFVLGGGAALLFFLFSPQMANLLRDPALTPYLRLSSAILFFYALYAVFIGVFNGQKRFKTQAFFDMTYSTLKTLLTLGLATLGWAVYGALGGFVASSFAICLIAGWKSGVRMKGGSFPVLPLLRFSFTVMGFAVTMNLILQTDLLLLKALSPPESSNLFAGYYTAGLTIARVPYMVISSLSFIIFPLVSRATHENNVTETEVYIQNGLRICLMLAVPVVFLFSASAPATVDLLYPETFRPAGEALRVVALGYLGLTLLWMSAAIISSSGHPHVSLALAVLTLSSQFALGSLLIPPNPLSGAAWSTTLASGVGLAAAAIWLVWRYHIFLHPLRALRIFSSGTLIYLISFWVPGEGLFLLTEDFLLALLYVGLLFVTKELTIEDFRTLRRSLGWMRPRELEDEAP